MRFWLGWVVDMSINEIFSWGWGKNQWMFNQNLFVTKPFDFGEAEIHGSFKTIVWDEAGDIRETRDSRGLGHSGSVRKWKKCLALSQSSRMLLEKSKRAGSPKADLVIVDLLFKVLTIQLLVLTPPSKDHASYSCINPNIQKYIALCIQYSTILG